MERKFARVLFFIILGLTGLALAEPSPGAVDSDLFEEFLEGLMPHDPGYTRLRKALASYTQILEKGGWPMIPGGRGLKQGEKNERVRILAERLQISGDFDRGRAPQAPSLRVADKEPNRDEITFPGSPSFQGGELHSSRDEPAHFFSKELKKAVKKFQHRHGLKADGIVGPKTLEALNVPVEARIDQIRANMQRWHKLPDDLGSRYLGVNIADYSLQVVEEGLAVLEMRVVVGKGYTRTPVFSAEMTRLVFRPYWNIPRRIALKEILPLIKNDPLYLRKNDLAVIRTVDGKEEEVAPQDIDWSKISDRYFPYYLRQSPGPQNPLGGVKFVLSNPFNVYLHDTPGRWVFRKRAREFSHGCIRLEKALALAEYVLRDQPGWTADRISAAMTRGRKNRGVRLSDPIPVHVFYWTAWVEDNGTVHFRHDTYNRDREKGVDSE